MAWRLLDSQYWGVPQRRKRIYLVGDFRAERGAEILFKPESELGYIDSRRPKKERIAAAVVRDFEVAGGVKENSCIADFGRTADRIYYNADKSRTLTATTGGGGSATGNYLDISEVRPINLQVATRCKALGERTGLGIGEDGAPANTLQEQHCHGVFATCVYDEAQITSTINASNPQLNAPCHTICKDSAGRVLCVELQDTGAVYPIRDPNLNKNANGFIVSPNGAPAPTLSATDRHAVAACFAPGGFGGFSEGVGTLRASSGKHGLSSSNVVAGVAMFENNSRGGSENLIVIFGKVAYFMRYILRKLTPLECERLQGFPDNWTKYGESGLKISDSPRYKALGNSLTVQCAERVFRGILAAVYNTQEVRNVKA